MARVPKRLKELVAKYNSGKITESEYRELMTYASDEDEDDDDIPEGCAACGGPYPDCAASCPAFDD